MGLNIKEGSASLNLASDTNTPPFEVKGLEVVSIQATWIGVTAFDGTMIIEASNNLLDWNVLDADENEITVDTGADSQIWNLQKNMNNYVRLRYTANSNTTGNAIILFDGRGDA